MGCFWLFLTVSILPHLQKSHDIQEQRLDFVLAEGTSRHASEGEKIGGNKKGGICELSMRNKRGNGPAVAAPLIEILSKGGNPPQSGQLFRGKSFVSSENIFNFPWEERNQASNATENSQGKNSNFRQKRKGVKQ